ncbi:flagellar protein FlaG [Methylobacterium oryzihabitans]|nr:flagellar protein FlaG [Methylobacterium oryzihabitans]
MPARREPPESPPLEPAVTLDLSPEARRSASQATEAAATAQARYRRDPDTRQMVFQVVDPTSGNVVDQLPSEAVLRARTYARESEAQQTTEIGTTVARTA